MLVSIQRTCDCAKCTIEVNLRNPQRERSYFKRGKPNNPSERLRHDLEGSASTIEEASYHQEEHMRYQIYNFIHQCNIGKPYLSRRRARRRADKLDLDYGAISHRIIEIA